MVKKVAIALSCLVLGSTLNASELTESEKFIGLEVGAAKIQADTLAGLDHKGDDVEFGFRLGAQNDSWRTMLVFDYFDSSEDDQNYEKGLLELDYYLMNAESETFSFRPFIGLNVGYMNYESTYIDENGFLYGGQAGFIVGVTQHVDFDVMYRYSFTNADQTDHVESVVVGFNYFY
ncbi:outer membrane beta-barrel protein [Sulfurovum sp. zt1-1]|uniref:Outer membrane beta-barrel protein n=1 Tax=Sulfurovum zhangzhouensis TaxID=3019067 RepID=A0ABT7QWX6_9BACT|nr:outer membrane beta-barrel protein [Sulfurovum zhangzhouensis]MDM5271282.1 outer membrane beta-barrel protein [Sulfurovum zhangzhouensis]